MHGSLILRSVTITLILGGSGLFSSTQAELTSRGKRFNFGFLRSSQSLLDFPHALPLTALRSIEKKTSTELEDDSREKRFRLHLFQPWHQSGPSGATFSSSTADKDAGQEVESELAAQELERGRRIRARLLCAIALRSRDACDSL
ncbi:hypothetical protein Tcan_08874 [Toxocara canis]|uniref:Uncharacterized protein n=2 Tax=Toxocara canis TaxID=6265 RepID=A0A0B2W218_TOXCA|nr:hypothetical protein Tcan_08874 [Toxocara canis]VDM24617.1 unnamed protein product [Toxocara canis]